MVSLFKPSVLAAVLLAAVGVAAQAPALAQASGQIYRCKDNLYTNDQNDARRMGCTAVQNANVTIVQPGQFYNMAAPGGFSNGTVLDHRNVRPANATVPDSVQVSRETERKAILQDELRTTQLRRDVVCAQLGADGNPQRQLNESDAQFALRASQIQADCRRSQSDLEALNRELGQAR